MFTEVIRGTVGDRRGRRGGARLEVRLEVQV